MNEAFLERDRVGNSQSIALYKHGAHFNPHLETIAASDASSNTPEKRKWPAFMHIPCGFDMNFYRPGCTMKGLHLSFHWL